MKFVIPVPITDSIKAANKVWIAGNGGSASLADHFACDLLKNCKIPAISLCSNTALITAISNDIGYRAVFVRQLMELANAQDLVILLSTRGNSPNLVATAEYCEKVGISTLGVTGYTGGKLKPKCKYFQLLRSSNMQDCEDLLGEWCHTIYKILSEG